MTDRAALVDAMVERAWKAWLLNTRAETRDCASASLRLEPKPWSRATTAPPSGTLFSPAMSDYSYPEGRRADAACALHCEAREMWRRFNDVVRDDTLRAFDATMREILTVTAPALGAKKRFEPGSFRGGELSVAPPPTDKLAAALGLEGEVKYTFELEVAALMALVEQYNLATARVASKRAGLGY